MKISFKEFLSNSTLTETVSDKLANKLGIPRSKLAKLTNDEIRIIMKDLGKHDFEPDGNFNPKELKRGIEVEKEHTNSELVAKLIAKDHLSEIPDYYTRLGKMEAGAKNT